MPNKSEALPDPTNKTVIIVAGEFAGEEGFCLGRSGNGWAVTPTSSNRILTLQFDADFGILLNIADPSEN